jgi:thioredoxin-like negative regulator of GroEL
MLTPAVEEATDPAAEEAAETPEEEATETPEEETAIDQFAKEEAEEPQHQDSGAIEQFAKEENTEPQHAALDQYQAPEGEGHDSLIDQYHTALSFGDVETARGLYKQLQEHRYSENMHRTKSDVNAAQEEQDYLNTCNELAAKHPELGQDGMEANEALTLSDLYRSEGMSPSDAIRKAVAKLYPDATPMEAEMPAPEAEMPAPMMEEALPDMSERMASKEGIQAVPSAAAKNEPEPPAETPTRASAIEAMRASRNQK